MGEKEKRWFSTKEVEGFGASTYLFGIGIVLDGPTIGIFFGKRIFVIGPHLKPKDKQNEASKQS